MTQGSGFYTRPQDGRRGKGNKSADMTIVDDSNDLLQAGDYGQDLKAAGHFGSINSFLNGGSET